MELIIKPTSSCNFKCSFCSAGKLQIPTIKKIDERFKSLIEILQPTGLIFTGGDPLCVSRDVYYQFLELGNYSISFTTNLKAFYNNPDYWSDLFKNSRVGVCTSFQFGNGRKWDEQTIYDQSLFEKVIGLFKRKIGYVPTFISVLDESTKDTGIKLALLAKKLDTKVKINGVLDIGFANNTFPLYKLIDVWYQVYEAGLWKYTDHKTQFDEGGCGFNTNGLCQSSIRAAWIDINDRFHYGTCEDLTTNGNEIPLEKIKPATKVDFNLKNFINSKCISCELCRLCNGCIFRVSSSKADGDFCNQMKKRIPIIKQMKWKI